MDLIIGADGDARAIYGEDLDFTRLGDVQIRRASHVEPDASGRWWADLSPVSGPKLGPFTVRTAALAAEISWLADHLSQLPTPLPNSKEVK